MASLVFVHGTGGRQKAYAETLLQMERSLKAHHLDLKLVPCLWGDPLGAKLNGKRSTVIRFMRCDCWV